MFELLLEEREIEYRRTFGRVAAAIVNSAPFVKRDRAISEEDVFPDYRKRAQRERQSVEDQIKFFSRMMGCGPDKPGTFHPRTKTVH